MTEGLAQVITPLPTTLATGAVVFSPMVRVSTRSQPLAPVIVTEKVPPRVTVALATGLVWVRPGPRKA